MGRARSPLAVAATLVAAMVVLLLLGHRFGRRDVGAVSLERGREVFEGRGRCATCHAREGDGAGYRGPVLGADLAERAATRVDGQSAVDYVVLSLYRPTAHTVEGYPMGLMPAANLPPLNLDADDVASVALYLLSEVREPRQSVPGEPGEARLQAEIQAALGRHGDVVLRPAAPRGDPEHGRALFVQLGCPSCHALAGVTDPAAVRAPGPELTGIADYQSPAYIAQSIWAPEAIISEEDPRWRGADGTSTRMPSYRDVIARADVDDLVAFLVAHVSAAP